MHAFITSSFVVSIEIGMSECFLISFTSGTTLFISSSTETGVKPGLVDSPPISIMSAPSSINCKALSIPPLLPSKKESGVAFTIPITNAFFSVDKILFPIFIFVLILHIVLLPFLCDLLINLPLQEFHLLYHD